MSSFAKGLSARHRPLLSGAFFRTPIWSGLLGITLLLPATYFMLTLTIRIFFGSATLYYNISPSFLQSPFGIFAWHKAQVILCGAMLAIVLNLLTVLRFRLQQGTRGLDVQVSYRRYWLNTAVALQGSLLLIVLLAYTLIQHIRY
ncbi:MAG TPA: hypothetical protein VK563_06550 [Puia sp.]|nr:hypothetical protein [Puia sp.]